MAIFHCSIKIISRSGGRTAVASAAYRAGEKLHNSENGLTYDFSRKSGVVHTEIMLPENAPSELSDRETLWNQVQAVEKRSDARLAREVEVALPIELTREQQIECVRKYIQKNFVSEGMIADWALHDKEDGNPHAHIMLTVRGFDEKQKWDTKKKSVFANARDDQGRAIYNPAEPTYDATVVRQLKSELKKAVSEEEKQDIVKKIQEIESRRIPQLDKNGQQKKRVRKGKGTELMWERIVIPSNDWNDRRNVEIWRKSWADICNEYLSPDQKIDHRSYKRQAQVLRDRGDKDVIEKVPQIHEGHTARKMEREGKISDRIQINRDIRQANSIRQQLHDIAEEIRGIVIEKARDILERFTGIERRRNIAGFDRGVGKTGRDDGTVREAAGRNRREELDNLEIEGESGRIAADKRNTLRAEQEITETNRQIAETDRDITETNAILERLFRLRAAKKRRLDERLAKLHRRRDISDTGGTVRRERRSPDRDPAGGRGSDTADLIREAENLLRSATAQGQAGAERLREAGARAESAAAHRADREAERERRAAEGRRAEAERSEIERRKNQRARERNRDEGPSL